MPCYRTHFDGVLTQPVKPVRFTASSFFAACEATRHIGLDAADV